MRIKPKVSFAINHASSPRTIGGILDDNLFNKLKEQDPELKSVKAYLLAMTFDAYKDLFELSDSFDYQAIPVRWFNSDKLDRFLEILRLSEQYNINPVFIISDLMSKIKFMYNNYNMSKYISEEGLFKFVKKKEHASLMSYHFVGNPLIDTVADYFNTGNGLLIKIKQAQQTYLNTCTNTIVCDEATFYQAFGREPDSIVLKLKNMLLLGADLDRIIYIAFGMPNYYKAYPTYSSKLEEITKGFTDIDYEGYLESGTIYRERDKPFFKKGREAAKIIRRVITSG